MKYTKHGFTLVELLVVIAIIGILIALLLPAVQAAREAARRMQCTNNMKQIGLAVHSYHDANNVLPYGAMRTGELANGSSLVRLLPYVEQQAVYDRLAQYFLDKNACKAKGADYYKSSPIEQWGTDMAKDTDGKLIAKIKMPAYICPSDAQASQLQKLGTGFEEVYPASYASSVGPTRWSGLRQGACPSTSAWYQYTSVYTDLATQPAGPFCNVGAQQMSFQEIPDGLSNTIFYGELRVAYTGFTMIGWVWHDCDGFTFTSIPLNHKSSRAVEYGNQGTQDQACDSRFGWGTSYGFKSCHAGGVNFLMGDGAVTFTSDTINPETLRRMGDRRDRGTDNIAP